MHNLTWVSELCFFCFLKICLCFYCNQVQLSRSRNSTILTLIQILAFWFFQQYYSCSSSLSIYSLGLQIRSAYVPRFHFKHNLQIIGLRWGSFVNFSSRVPAAIGRVLEEGRWEGLMSAHRFILYIECKLRQNKCFGNFLFVNQKCYCRHPSYIIKCH